MSRYTIGAVLEQQTARDGTEIVLRAEPGNEDAAHLAQLVREVDDFRPVEPSEVA